MVSPPFEAARSIPAAIELWRWLEADDGIFRVAPSHQVVGHLSREEIWPCC